VGSFDGSGKNLEWDVRKLRPVRSRTSSPPPPGELFSETNDNSVAIVLSYATARVLLAGDAEAREEEYMAGGPYTGPLTVINVRKHKTIWATFLCPADRGYHPSHLRPTW
jgi:beta-lactamase superfamily II metal-dependent hydrolase